MKWCTQVFIALLWSAAILVLLFGFQPPASTPNPMKVSTYQNPSNGQDVYLTKLDK
jgi:hypothetical protein